MAAEKLEESNRTLYKTRRQEELGLKGKADVAQFEAQVAADDYTLTHQQNLFNTALLTLRECMNYPSDLELEVDTLLPDINYVPEVENVAEIFAYASGNNPTALQAEYQLTQSKYQYRIYKGKLLPSIYLNAGISTSYFENLKSDNAPEGFKDQFKNNRGEYVSFSLSFPLFDGLSRLTNARRYRNNMRIARETRTEVFRQLQTAVEQSVLDREGYAKEAIQMDKKVRSDELAYRVTLRKYEEGLHNLLWVWNSDVPEAYPGDSYVDVVSMDVYLPEYLPTDYAETYKKLVTATSRNKITALAEIGYLPDIELLQKSRIPWAYYMTWSKEFCIGEKYNSVENLKKMYDSEYAVTL